MRRLYEMAREVDPADALRMMRAAESQEERSFWAYVGDMNLRRRQHERIAEQLRDRLADLLSADEIDLQQVDAVLDELEKYDPCPDFGDDREALERFKRRVNTARPAETATDKSSTAPE